MMDAPKIIITVEGGCVQAIEGIPPNVKVIVHDYDVCEEDETKEDKDGNRYREAVWS